MAAACIRRDVGDNTSTPRLIWGATGLAVRVRRRCDYGDMIEHMFVCEREVQR